MSGSLISREISMLTARRLNGLMISKQDAFPGNKARMANGESANLLATIEEIFGTIIIVVRKDRFTGLGLPLVDYS